MLNDGMPAHRQTGANDGIKTVSPEKLKPLIHSFHHSVFDIGKIVSFENAKPPAIKQFNH